MVTALCSGISTTPNVSSANTSLLRQTKLPLSAPAREPANPAERIAAATEILSPETADLYRQIFTAQKRGDWDEADAALARLQDKRLLGHVLADRYQRRPAKTEELAAWLKTYAALPQADEIHAKASYQAHHGPVVLPALTAPKSPDLWRAGGRNESAADFSSDLADGPLAQGIQKALKNDNPKAALALLVKAQSGKTLSGTAIADAEATIAAAFFYAGEREQASILASTAAAMNQPQGLWIQGLIAWEKGESGEAALAFQKLSEHPSLTPANEAAAHFWAYRALSRSGHAKEAYRHLDLASRSPNHFYGILAGQLMGRDTVALYSIAAPTPAWDAKKKALLASTAAGSRALALLQVGETTLAEKELRRLDPRGDAPLQQAMAALAAFVPMPGLAMQLAAIMNAGGENQTVDAAAYPLPPWVPQQGFQIDKAFLFALARHESLFDPAAVSSRGACGLMQLMPSTASVMMNSAAEAKALKTNGKLFDPTYNLELGQKYVRRLTEQPKIGHNLLFLLAAYNSGPGKASRWIETRVKTEDAKAARDPLLFVETLPVRETRLYIGRVLPHYWAYQARLGHQPASLKALAENKWPQLPLAAPVTRTADAR